jgi:hypothetical protein
MVEGMEKKLFPASLGTKGLQGMIIGHRLNYLGISIQQEQTWSKSWIEKAGEPLVVSKLVPPKPKNLDAPPTYKKVTIRTVNRRPATGILKRGVLIEPHLYLAFATEEYARIAASQHICMCRNEDVLLPAPESIMELSAAEWGEIPGFELRWTDEAPASFKVGHNRYDNAAPMYGHLVSVGDPIRKAEGL